MIAILSTESEAAPLARSADRHRCWELCAECKNGSFFISNWHFGYFIFYWLFMDLGEGAKRPHMSFKSAIFMWMPSS
jgi:hypothetical protein